MRIDTNKHIWEGWYVRDFIEELQPYLDEIMQGNDYHPFENRVFTTKAEIAKWTSDNQPYYKKVIPEVVSYFCDRYNIKK